MWQVELGLKRFKDIKLENGILKPGELNLKQGELTLWPFRRPDLPTEFAKVHDDKSAIRFELDYAPLGYDYLVGSPDDQKGGDPLEWVLEHARFVRFAIDLVYSFAHQDAPSLKTLLKEHTTKIEYETPMLDSGIVMSSKGSFPYAELRVFTYPSGFSYKEGTTLFPTIDSDILGVIPSLIANLVNDNTKNMHQELWQDEFLWVMRFRSLIEVIWSMVGDIALKSTGEGDYFRRCEWCNTPFLATDKRQRFCPPPEVGGGLKKQSLCGLQYRQHKVQANKKGGTK